MFWLYFTDHAACFLWRSVPVCVCLQGYSVFPMLISEQGPSLELISFLYSLEGAAQARRAGVKNMVPLCVVYCLKMVIFMGTVIDQQWFLGLQFKQSYAMRPCGHAYAIVTSSRYFARSWSCPSWTRGCFWNIFQRPSFCSWALQSPFAYLGRSIGRFGRFGQILPVLSHITSHNEVQEYVQYRTISYNNDWI